MAIVRKHIYFFRAGAGRWISLPCQKCGESHDLTGWVDNLWDGRVEMEVQESFRN